MTDSNLKGFTFTHTMKDSEMSDRLKLHPMELYSGHEMHLTLHVEDPAIYRALLDENPDKSFTFSVEHDLNPHHSKPPGFRSRLRRIGRIVRWHWRKLIRKPLPESYTVTAYDVQPENIAVEGP